MRMDLLPFFNLVFSNMFLSLHNLQRQIQLLLKQCIYVSVYLWQYVYVIEFKIMPIAEKIRFIFQIKTLLIKSGPSLIA